nr:uncharacterized mitochondrial protein AtMg00810-like [Tanacetum cinerariifolium]
MVEKSKLDEDKEGKAVDLSHYHGMIGTLLYLTSGRPDFQFAIYMCARYQARPIEKHVHAVKRIFRYLRGTVHRGLWYPKDSFVALTAFADAGHAGCQDTRRSTSGSVQYLGERLISWSSKRQKSAAISNSNPVFILKASIPPKRKLDLTTGIQFLGHGLLCDHAKDCVYFTTQPGLLIFPRTMDTTIEQQLAMDEALVPMAQRLKIGRSNFRLLSDIKSKDLTLQLVYDVLRRCLFFKAFLVTADVSEIYMQEFWATTTVHHLAILFKMDNKKHILDLESFRNTLHICPRVQGQPFAETSFEEEIFSFIHFLGHSAAIRTLADVNIGKLYQPWRSFAALINKCLSEKSSGYDSLRLSQAQILWGLYHKRNVDYAYLMWEDFVYQVEHKNQKKGNEMYYPRFTKAIIHHFMSKDPSIPRRNKVNWHYVRDNFMFSTIKLVSRHQNMQQFGALLPIELANDEIRNSKAYKEYYAIATGEAAPKPKANVRRTRSSSDTSITPPTAAASPRLKAFAKGKQPAKASKAKSLSALFEVAMTEAQQLKLVTKRSMQQTHISQPNGSGVDEGTGSKPGVLDVPTDESEEELSWNSTDDKGDDNKEQDDDGDEEDEGDDGEKANGDDDDDEDDDGEEGDDDDADQEVVRDDDKDDDEEDSEDETDGKEDLVLNIGEEERHDEEEEEDELYRDQESSSVSSLFITSMLNLTFDVGMQSIFETTSRIDVQTPTFVAPLLITTPTMTSSTIATTTTTTSQAPILPTTIPSDIIQHLPSFGLLFRFDDRLRSLEENFSEVMQTNQFAGAVSAIPEIVQHYMDQRMNEAVKVAVQIQLDRLSEEAQRDNDKFLKTVDENIKKIIMEQVKEQVKAQVSKILPRIEQAVNEQLEAKVLTKSSHSSRTSYVVAVDLSEMEVKKILIEKIEGNKSIQRSDEQRNLYKALVEAYEFDKILLDKYGETVTLKRRHDDDEARMKNPPLDQTGGQKDTEKASASEYAFVEEPVHTTSQMEKPSYLEFDTGAKDQPIIQSSQHPEWFSQPQKPPTLDRDWNKTLPTFYESIQPWISELAKQADTRSSFNKLMDTPLEFSNFIMNRLRVDTLTPELLAGPTYDLMKGSCKSLIELEYHLEEVYKATTDQLDWVNPEGQQYPHNLLQALPLIPDNRGRHVIPFAHFINNDLEYLWGGASSCKYTALVTKTKTADYGHIKWIENLFYGFAVNWESARDIYSKRIIITVTELKIVEWHSYKHLDWITRRVEDLQLGVESYQKRLNLTKPNTYRSDLKRKEAYTAYSNPRGFIYQNKDKKNRSILTDLQEFVNIVLTLCDAGDSVVRFSPYYFNAYMSFQMTGVTDILVGPGDPNMLHTVSANVVDRSIGTDNPRLSFRNFWSLVDHATHLTFE